jgi:hypothetical protein
LSAVIQFKRNRILVLKEKPTQGVANKNIMNIISRQPEHGPQTQSHEPPSNRGNFKIKDNATIEDNANIMLQDHNRRRIHAVVDAQHTR